MAGTGVKVLLACILSPPATSWYRSSRSNRPWIPLFRRTRSHLTSTNGGDILPASFNLHAFWVRNASASPGKGIMQTKLCRGLAVLFLISTFSGNSSILLHAQGTNGTIQGTVTDPSGASVNGARVEVKNLRTGITRTVATNEQGRYRVPDLI